MTDSRDDLIDAFDYGHARLLERLTGLADSEYFWAPVADPVTVRPGPRGGFLADPHRGIDAGPSVSTIAWRLDHIVEMFIMPRNATWLAVPAPSSPPWTGAAGTAAEAITRLGLAYLAWRACMSASTETSLTEPIGPLGGPYAEATRRAFALHLLDEYVHHGAEVALMRDLYACR